MSINRKEMLIKSECDRCKERHYIWNLYHTEPCYWLCVDCKVEHDIKICKE